MIYISNFTFNWALLDAIDVERKAEIDQCVLCDGSGASPFFLLGGQIWVGLCSDRGSASGEGEALKVCNIICTACQRYKDAPYEFDEIAAKAKSTVVILERLDNEAKAVGNLAKRAGPQAFNRPLLV